MDCDCAVQGAGAKSRLRRNKLPKAIRVRVITIKGNFVPVARIKSASAVEFLTEFTFKDNGSKKGGALVYVRLNGPQMSDML